MLVQDDLIRTARRAPERLAIIAAGQGWSFGRVDHDSDRLAAALQELGIRRGDRVAVMLDNGAEMVIALWATLKAGAVFVPVSPATRPDKLAFVLADAEVAGMIAPAPWRDTLAAAWTPRVRIWVGEGEGEGDGHSLADILARPHRTPRPTGQIDQDLCLLIYTSGTTGRAKGVMMTHAAIRNNTRSIARYLGNTPADIVLCVLPLTFSYGLFQVLVGARVGYATVLEKSFAFPAELLKLMAAHRVTGLPGVPTLFAGLLQQGGLTGHDLSALRYVTNAAAPLAPAQVLKLRQALPQVAIYSMYGLTECTRVSYLDPAKVADKPGSVGTAIPNAEILLIDEDGRPVAPGEVGELVVRGAGLMRGYWRRPEDTARALREGALPGEKQLHTGDLFRMDPDGDLYFVGRRDDVFKCRGEKVSPREVETVLYELAEVLEAAVIGVPCAVDGMAVKAFVVPRTGATLTEAQVRRHCRARLEPRQVPQRVELCTTLPRTLSGKIATAALRLAAAPSTTDTKG